MEGGGDKFEQWDDFEVVKIVELKTIKKDL
jgi:hypothetical protein